MKTYGCGSINNAFLTLAPDGGEWPASRPGLLSAGIYWVGGWLRTRAGLNRVAKKDMSLPGIESQSPSP
jgi:hypothetical protein